MARDKAKLYFKTTDETLKAVIECNTIPQVVLNFNYVERWGSDKKVRLYATEDSKNVTDFFTSVRKLSDSGFQPKKFKELWDKCNMPDITEYEVLTE